MKTEAELRDAVRWFRADLRRMKVCRCATCLCRTQQIVPILAALEYAIGGDGPLAREIDRTLRDCRDHEDTATFLADPKTA